MNITEADEVWFNPQNIVCATFKDGSDKPVDKVPPAHLTVWVPNDNEPFEVFGVKARLLMNAIRSWRSG